MAENSRSPRVLNALAWYPWAKALHLESLARQCTRTIAWNFDAIVSSDDWVGMDADFVADMAGSSELVVNNEWSVWEALSTWLLHGSRGEVMIIRRRTFIKRHKSRRIHSEALYMSMYTCVVE